MILRFYQVEKMSLWIISLPSLIERRKFPIYYEVSDEAAN